VQQQYHLMNKKNSLLLPPQFFENDLHKKLDYIFQFKIDVLYLFDHLKNPIDVRKPTYKLTEEVFNLYEKVNNKIKIGVCVLNVNTRYLGKLLKDILEPLLELKSISLGLGTGDNKYENHDFLYENNIEDIICYILENKNFIHNESQLFLGGNSKEKLDLVKKYNLGINQWMGLDSNFVKKHNIYNHLFNPVGSLSRCITHENQLEFDYEKIHILKDSNLKIFQESIDNIFKNE
jgi:hypothetical protein